MRMCALDNHRLALAFVAALAVGTGCAGGGQLYRTTFDLPEFPTDVAERRLEMVPMRDGVRLATDVYLPQTEGPWPVILIRDPYSVFDMIDPIMQTLTRYGYAVVHQDVRGRLRSEGKWNPIKQEREDGIDAMQWVLEQPFFNGKMALYGPSYLGISQWAVLHDLPPEVKTIVPQVSSTSLFKTAYEDGMFKHEVLSFWASAMPHAFVAPQNTLTYQSAIRAMPNDDNNIHLGESLPWYREWQRSAAPDAPLWSHPTLVRAREAVKTTKVPVLLVGGWYDIFLRGQLDDWNRLGSRAKSRYIIGPWTHLMGVMGDGEKDFPGAEHFALLDEHILNWFAHHLKGEPLRPWGPLRIYRIGKSEWEDRTEWPKTTPVDFYLGAAKQATRCRGGSLDVTPSPHSVATFVYDPRDPVPTNGGSQLLSWVFPGYGGALPSNRDQSEVCEREDVLTFVSPPFGEEFHLSGPMVVELTVQSSAPDTAFTAKLIEIDSEGQALNVRDGITSLAWRNDAQTRQSYTPHQTVDVTVDLTAIEWTFARGSRLRLDISSSNFPAFHAHPNRAGLWSAIEGADVATQRVLLGGQQSRLRVGRRVGAGQSSTAAAVHP